VSASPTQSSKVTDDGALRELAEILARGYVRLLVRRDSRGKDLACSRNEMALLSDAGAGVVPTPRKEAR